MEVAYPLRRLGILGGHVSGRGILNSSNAQPFLQHLDVFPQRNVSTL